MLVFMTMTNPDTLAISQRLAKLDQPALAQVATSLATESIEKTAQNQALKTQVQEMNGWVSTLKARAEKRLGGPTRFVTAVSAGGVAGALYGSLSEKAALVVTTAASAAGIATAAVAHHYEAEGLSDAALSLASGMSAASLGIQSAKLTSEYMANRSAAKANKAVAQAAAGSTKSKG